MLIETLVSKYIASAEQVLNNMERLCDPLTVDVGKIGAVLEYVHDYLEDAKYYEAQKRFETSLAAVAYCEGLLDALRLLGAVRFEWSSNQKNQK